MEEPWFQYYFSVPQSTLMPWHRMGPAIVDPENDGQGQPLSVQKPFSTLQDLHEALPELSDAAVMLTKP